MSPLKDQVIRMIRDLPDDCTLEDIHYHLYVRARVERGLRAVEEGRIVSQKEAEARVDEWLASSGLNPPSKTCERL